MPELCLVGSCGSNKRGDLGKVFFVNKAIKGDHGSTNLEGVFHWKKDKLISREAKLDKHTLAEAEDFLFKQDAKVTKTEAGPVRLTHTFW